MFTQTIALPAGGSFVIDIDAPLLKIKIFARAECWVYPSTSASEAAPSVAPTRPTKFLHLKANESIVLDLHGGAMDLNPGLLSPVVNSTPAPPTARIVRVVGWGVAADDLIVAGN